MSSATFIVRNAQMEALLAMERQKFLDETVALLRNDHSDLLEEIPAEEVRGQVAALMERAEKLGFHLYADVVQFIILSLSLGPDFESLPEYSEVRDLLHESDIDPSIRLTRVRHFLERDDEKLPVL